MKFHLNELKRKKVFFCLFSFEENAYLLFTLLPALLQSQREGGNGAVPGAASVAKLSVGFAWRGGTEPAVPPSSEHRRSAEPCAGPGAVWEPYGHVNRVPRQPSQLQWGCGRFRTERDD